MLYDPRQVKIYKLQLGMMCSYQYHDLPLKGPLSVKLDFYREYNLAIVKNYIIRKPQEP